MRLRNINSKVVVTVRDGHPLGGDSDWEEIDGEASTSPDKSWKVADLKVYAEENGIDLGDATTKADILTVIDADSEEPDDDTTGED